jgi:hypothetical protein
MYGETYDVSSILNWEFVFETEAVITNFIILYSTET